MASNDKWKDQFRLYLKDIVNASNMNGAPSGGLRIIDEAATFAKAKQNQLSNSPTNTKKVSEFVFDVANTAMTAAQHAVKDSKNGGMTAADTGEDIKQNKTEAVGGFAKLNNFAGGSYGQTISAGLDMVSGFIKNRPEYSGKYGGITKSADAAYDTTMKIVSKIPGWGLAAGLIMGAGKLANKAVGRLGGGTDGMTKTDALLGSNFLGLTPLGLINGFGGKKADTYTRNLELDTATNGGYQGFLTTQDLTQIGAGKKYGAFSSGARHKQNQLTEFTQNMKHTVSGVVDTNTINNLAAQGSTPFIAQQQSIDLSGGVQLMRAARKGMKLKEYKRPKGVKNLSPKKYGPEGMILLYDKNGNPTRGLTRYQELGYEPVVGYDGKARFIGYDSNPALQYMLSAKNILKYSLGSFMKRLFPKQKSKDKQWHSIIDPRDLEGFNRPISELIDKNGDWDHEAFYNYAKLKGFEPSKKNVGTEEEPIYTTVLDRTPKSGREELGELYLLTYNKPLKFWDENTVGETKVGENIKSNPIYTTNPKTIGGKELENYEAYHKPIQVPTNYNDYFNPAITEEYARRKGVKIESVPTSKSINYDNHSRRIHEVTGKTIGELTSEFYNYLKLFDNEYTDNINLQKYIENLPNGDYKDYIKARSQYFPDNVNKQQIYNILKEEINNFSNTGLFFNENLLIDYYNKHRKVIEPIGEITPMVSYLSVGKKDINNYINNVALEQDAKKAILLFMDHNKKMLSAYFESFRKKRGGQLNYKRVVSKYQMGNKLRRSIKVLDVADHTYVDIPLNLTLDLIKGREPIRLPGNKIVFMNGDGTVTSDRWETLGLREHLTPRGLNGMKMSYNDWYNGLRKKGFTNINYDYKRAYETLPYEELIAHYNNPNKNHLHSVALLPNGDYIFLKLGKHGSEVDKELAAYSNRKTGLEDTHDLKFNEFENRYYYIRKKGPNAKQGEFSKNGNIVSEFKKGGQMNVIPEGALHARLNHLDLVSEDLSKITPKGIPVITKEEGGEVVLHAEIEHSEIIFTLDVTNKIEDLRKKWHEDKKDEYAIEAGKILVKEILHNTDDRVNLIKTI